MDAGGCSGRVSRSSPPRPPPTRSARRSSPIRARARCPRHGGHNKKPLIVCKSNSKRLIKKIFKGKKRKGKRLLRLRAAQELPLPQHPDRGQPRQEQRPHRDPAGPLSREAEPQDPGRPARVRVDVRDARRRRRAGAELRAPGQVPELAQPDRDHRRLARRPGPRVRPQVQPPDGGPRPQAQGRQDRGRPAEEGRHPRRPRRRLLPPQRVGRAGRLQRRRRGRDQRLPPARPGHPVRAELRRAHLRLRPRPVPAHRRVQERRLRDLPGLRARGPLQALRDRDPQRQLARQRARLLGHRGQRHLDAQLEVPRQQRRHLRRLVRLRPPRHAAGLLEVGEQRGQLEQPELLHERPRHVLQEHAVREARQGRSCARSSRSRSAPASSSTASTRT